jgi:hypothetical protein
MSAGARLERGDRAGGTAGSEAQSDQPIHETRRQEIGSDVARQRRELDDVEPHDAPVLGHRAQQIDELVPVETPGFGGSGGGHHRRIQSVDVDRDVHLVRQRVEERRPISAQRAPLTGAPHRPGMTLEVLRFLLGERPDSHRGRRGHLAHAAHRAGVAVGRPQVRVSHVGVSVDLEHRQPGVTACRRAHGTHREAVLAAQHHRELAALQDPLDRPLDASHHRLGSFGGRLELGQCVDARAVHRPDLFVPELHVP